MTRFLLHGFLGSREDWGDTPGESLDLTRYVSHINSLGCSFGEGVDRLVTDILLRFGEGPHEFVGYSMGGRIVLDIAMRYPQLVSHAVMISSSPGLHDYFERESRRLADGELAERLDAGGVAGLPAFLETWYSQPLFDSFRLSEGFDAVIERRLRIDPHANAQLLRTFGVGAQPSYWEALPGLSVPLHVVVGELDTKYCAIATQMRVLNTDITVDVVPLAGHVIYFWG